MSFWKVYPFLLFCLHDAWRRFSVCLVLAFALHACRNVWSRRSLSVGCVAALWHLASEPWSSSGRLRAQRLLAMAAVKMYVEVKRKSQCLSVRWVKHRAVASLFLNLERGWVTNSTSACWLAAAAAVLLHFSKLIGCVVWFFLLKSWFSILHSLALKAIEISYPSFFL